MACASGCIFGLVVRRVRDWFVSSRGPPGADRPDRGGGVARVVDEIETVEETTTQDDDEGPDSEERSWKTWDEG